MKCNYGCGKDAKNQLKNGKWCCEEFASKCSNIRKKNTEGLKTAHLSGKYDDANFISWNKGLTKETDSRIKKSGETFSSKYKSGKIIQWCTGKTKYTDLRIKKLSESISKTVYKKIEDGTWHNSFSKSRTHEYNGMKFYGTWELKYAKYLDENFIKWIKNKDKFKYFFDNKNRTYTPDFYLFGSDCYIEIKGYETEKDRAKWNQFPKNKKLVVLKGKELFNMGIIKSFRKLKTDYNIKDV